MTQDELAQLQPGDPIIREGQTYQVIHVDLGAARVAARNLRSHNVIHAPATSFAPKQEE